MLDAGISQDDGSHVGKEEYCDVEEGPSGVLFWFLDELYHVLDVK